jgi:hypothetical protein
MKYGQPNQPVPQDQPNTGLQIVSVLFPIVGWILWGVNKSDKPIAAKSYSKMAWIGVGISLLFGIL